MLVTLSPAWNEYPTSRIASLNVSTPYLPPVPCRLARDWEESLEYNNGKWDPGRLSVRHTSIVLSFYLDTVANTAIAPQGHSRRPVGGEKKSRGFGRSKPVADVGDGRGAGGKPQVKKAVFESTKKKEIGVSDLTLLSKISNEAINDNLKLRFDHGEIYVGFSSHICQGIAGLCALRVASGANCCDRPISDMCWCLSTRFETVGLIRPI